LLKRLCPDPALFDSAIFRLAPKKQEGKKSKANAFKDDRQRHPDFGATQNRWSLKKSTADIQAPKGDYPEEAHNQERA